MARLTMSDRRTLAKMYAEEKSVLEIANKLGCHPQTIYDELKRGNTGKLDKNHRQADAGRPHDALRTGSLHQLQGRYPQNGLPGDRAVQRPGGTKGRQSLEQEGVND